MAQVKGGTLQIAAAAIMTEMPEIGRLRKKAVAALAGVAPITRQSGKWRGQSYIQGGRKPLRDALYMPALVAIRHNPDLKAQYNRMKAKGKPSKVALTAFVGKTAPHAVFQPSSLRKLLILAKTLVKENREWQEIRP